MHGKSFFDLPEAISKVSPGEVLSGLRFVWKLRAFLRHPFSAEEARLTLRRRLERREENFLFLARHCIYERSASPYRKLLQYAGCTYDDLRQLVRVHGLEGALGKLQGEGVYLTVEEFKGRRVKRGTLGFEIHPGLLGNPLTSSDIWVQSGGSRGTREAFSLDLSFVQDHAVNTHLTLAAHGGTEWRHAHWGMPGGAAVVNLLEFCKGGTPPVRWFSQIDHRHPQLHPRYRWSPRALSLGSLGNAAIPAPEFAGLDSPQPIVDWLSAVLRSGATPHLWTYASSAVRVCETAWKAGVDLTGARFTMGGEPSTAARLEVIRRAGGIPLPRYGATETDIIGYACMHPEAPDDMHLLDDRRAVIQTAGSENEPGLPPSTLLFSSLLPSDPLILLNVSLGDQAVLKRRACGCALEELGWLHHLHHVRSAEKLTAGGVNFLDADVIRVLEDVLPERFGGAPTDYQLVDQEEESGHPALVLLVDPALGPLDPNALRDTFLRAISAGVGVEKVMGMIWQDGRMLRVERQPPQRTPAGKILHLHRASGA